MFSKVFILAALVGIAVASLPVDHEPIHHAPKPYKFGYDIKDKHGEQYRQEEGNGGHAVKGSYGFTDEKGVKRQVDYVADKAGFRAQVKTNEPGTANQNPAAVLMASNAPYAGGVGLGNGGYGYGGLGLASGVYGNGLGYAVPAYGGMGYGGMGGNGGYGVGNLGYGGYDLGNLGYGGYDLGNLGYGRYDLGNLGYGGYGLGGLGYAGY